VRSEVKKASDSRKYNLNNPFYQPLALQFASVTDLSYGYNSLDFMILENSGGWANNPGNYSASNFSITENLSFGITDDVIILGQIRLASSKLNIHWDLVADPMFSDDKQSTNKMDLMGAGVQWRVVNDSDWIASIMGAIQSLTDAATVFTGEAKLGYKNDDTTIYWFGRVMFYNWDGTSGYGFGLKNQHGQTEYFSTVENVTSSVWYDLGMGIFAALNSDWSADIQLTYSGAEWHNQISGRAGISYQSWKNASIGFYGRVALWDSADKFDKSSVLFMQNDGSVSRQGTAAFSNYSDFALGVQLTATF
jgi:hypothetical protein